MLQSLLEKHQASLHPLLDNTYQRYVELDLSEKNPALTPATTENFLNYHLTMLATHQVDLTIGRYAEKRSIYQTDLFLGKNARNIHLGVDLNVPVNTPIYAPLAGSVHSLNNNDSAGDYGPTIILKHQLDNQVFYTLYGHLSLADLSGCEPGQPIKHGGIVGHTGDATVNGGWPSHCHFQVIQDIGDHVGDYPGVCSETELSFYLGNCPNPYVFLSTMVAK